MSDDSGAPKSPFTRPGFIAAVAVIAVVILVGMIAVVSGLLSREDPGPTPTETVDPGAPTADDLSVCGLEGFERTSSLDAAPENEWELVGTVAAPTSEEAGPGVVSDDGLRTCFAHTAEGALYAAVNYVAVSSDPRLQPLLWMLLEEGTVRDEARAAAEAGEGSASSARLQVAGFRVLSYSGETAVVDVAWQVTSPNPGYISMPIELTWQTGDWLIATTETGLPYSPAQIQNLGGYLPWSGA